MLIRKCAHVGDSVLRLCDSHDKKRWRIGTGLREFLGTAFRYPCLRRMEQPRRPSALGGGNWGRATVARGAAADRFRQVLMSPKHRQVRTCIGSPSHRSAAHLIAQHAPLEYESEPHSPASFGQDAPPMYKYPHGIESLSPTPQASSRSAWPYISLHLE